MKKAEQRLCFAKHLLASAFSQGFCFLGKIRGHIILGSMGIRTSILVNVDLATSTILEEKAAFFFVLVNVEP